MSRYRQPSPSDYIQDEYPTRGSRTGGVIPVSTQKFVNGQPVRTSYEPYGDSRHSVGTIPADLPQRRTSTTAGSSVASRSRAIQNPDRPGSPTTRRYKYDTPASDSRGPVKKVYAYDDIRPARGAEGSGRRESVDAGRKAYSTTGQAPRDDHGRYDRGDTRDLYVHTQPQPE